IFPLRNLPARDAEPFADFSRRIGASFLEPFFKNLQRWRGQKNGDQRAFELRVLLGAGANRGGALDIDIEQEVRALAQFSQHLGFQSAVAVSIDSRMFEEIACLNAFQKRSRIQKVIIHAILLAWARGSSGAG